MKRTRMNVNLKTERVEQLAELAQADDRSRTSMIEYLINKAWLEYTKLGKGMLIDSRADYRTGEEA